MGHATNGLLWARELGTSGYEEARGVAADASGVYVAGGTNGTLPGQTDSGGNDAFVRKYDPSGTVVWTFQIGTPGDDEAEGVAADGTDIYVAGIIGGSLPGQTSAGGADAFVRKYDSSGTEVWTRQFGSSEGDYALAVAADVSGVYVAGYGGALPGQTGLGGAFVRRYDPGGTEMWTSQFWTPSGSVYAWGVATDGSSVYIAGRTDGTLPGQTSAGTWDAFLRKYDATGAELWTRQFGTSVFDFGWGVAADASGAYIVGLTTGTLPGQTNGGVWDAFVRKYDGAGTETWTHQIGTDSFDEAHAVAAGASGVYVAGLTGGTFPGQTSEGGGEGFVRKYDATGAELWTREFGTLMYDEPFGVATGLAEAYVVGRTDGTFPGETNEGGFEAFLVALSAPVAPQEPTNVQAVSGDTTVGLTWGPPAFDGGSPVTNYRIYRGTTAGSRAFLVEVAAVQARTDVGLTNGATYYYAVSAVNAIGEGPQSSEVSATPQSASTPPTITIVSPLDGTILTSATITVSGAASDDVAVEKVEVSVDGTAWVLASGTTSWSATVVLHAGSNTITARATDASENTATAMVIVERAVPPEEGTPLLFVEIFAAVAILVAAILVALYVLRRRKRDRIQPPVGRPPPTE